MKIIHFHKYSKIIFNLIIYFVIFYLLIHSKLVVSSILTSTTLFATKLLPALFPYILITEILINSGKTKDLALGISKFISKLFRIPISSSPAVIIGFLLGYPNSAKYILSLYNSHEIDSKTATKLTSFTSNANMSYIIGTIGIGMFQSFEIGIILTISHFLSAILVGITCRIPSNTNIIQQTNTNSNTFKKIYSPFDLLYLSIGGTLKTLAYILAFTVIFSLIPNISLEHIQLPLILKGLLTGICEISNGINELSSLNISFNLKLTLISFVLSFSSLMIQMQIFSFAYKAKVKFKDILKYKILQGILSCIITYVILAFIYIPIISVSLNNDVFARNQVCSPANIYTPLISITVLLAIFLFRKKRHG